MVVGDEGSVVGCSNEPVVPYSGGEGEGAGEGEGEEASGDSGVDAGDGGSAEFPQTRFFFFPAKLSSAASRSPIFGFASPQATGIRSGVQFR